MMDTTAIRQLSMKIAIANAIVWDTADYADLHGVDQDEMTAGIKNQITEISALLVELAGEVE